MIQVESHNSSLSDLDRRENPSGLDQPDRKQTDASKVVLVVDDDPDLLDVTSFVLESEGFGVDIAKNGAEALERLRAGKLPGLVLLDLMMPVMNGWEFLDAVAKEAPLASIPIVVLTAAEPKRVPGAAEVLRKPINLGLLIETVERLARWG